VENTFSAGVMENPYNVEENMGEFKKGRGGGPDTIWGENTLGVKPPPG